MRILAFLLFLPMLCMAQKDPCKRVTQTMDENRGVMTLSSPLLKHTSVIKQFQVGTFFGLVLRIASDHPQANVTGASVTFEDGTTISDAGIAVECTEDAVTMDSRSVNSLVGYLLHSYIRITDDNVNTFMTKKIVSFKLGDNVQKVQKNEAEEVIRYVTCMKDKKQ